MGWKKVGCPDLGARLHFQVNLVCCLPTWELNGIAKALPLDSWLGSESTRIRVIPYHTNTYLGVTMLDFLINLLSGSVSQDPVAFQAGNARILGFCSWWRLETSVVRIFGGCADPVTTMLPLWSPYIHSSFLDRHLWRARRYIKLTNHFMNYFCLRNNYFHPVPRYPALVALFK